MKRLLNLSKLTWFFYFLLIFISIEAFNKIYSFYVDQDFIVQKVVKLLALGLMLGILLIKNPHKLIFASLLTVCFVLGQFLLPDAFTTASLIGFGRYFFFLTIVLFFADFQEIYLKKLKLIFKFWELFLWINSLLILVAVGLELSIFATYKGERWGYNALIMASSNSTYFYLVALLYFFLRFPQTYFKYALFWLSLIAALCTGTKSIYLGVLLMGLVVLLTLHLSKKIKWFLALGIIFLGIASMFFLFSSKVFTAIIEKDGWLSAILSYRDELLLEDTIPYIQENWKTIHYFIGGLSQPLVRPQLELIDLFLYFGVFGMLVYLYVFFKNYFSFRLLTREVILFTILLMVPLITGNFFYNASVPIYLILIKLVMKERQLILSKTDRQHKEKPV